MANYNYALQQKKIFVRFGQTIFLSWIKFNLFFQKSKISKKKKINQKYSQMWNKFFAQCQNQTEEKTKIEQQKKNKKKTKKNIGCKVQTCFGSLGQELTNV